jgi:cytochrome c
LIEDKVLSVSFVIITAVPSADDPPAHPAHRPPPERTTGGATMPSRSPLAGGCRAVLAGGLALGLAVSAAPATAASIQRGLTLARTHCATCHAIDRVSPSPLTAAPAFRDLHRSYAVENLSEALARES